MEQIWSYINFIGLGISMTLKLTLISLMIGFVCGSILSILRYKQIATPLINIIISLIRGTPIILQLSFVYFALPNLFNIHLSIMWSGIVALGLNSTAYIAEILKAGINSIPKGQFEAARTLRISSFHTWKDIILPQVIRNILPAMISEAITLLKETAIISTIGGMDILRHAQLVAAEQFTYFLPLCVAGAYYYILVLIIEYLGRQIQRKYSYA